MFKHTDQTLVITKVTNMSLIIWLHNVSATLEAKYEQQILFYSFIVIVFIVIVCRCFYRPMSCIT